MIKLDLGIKKPSIKHLMDYFKETHRNEVSIQTINYVGSNDGSKDFKRDLYPSVLNYRFNDPINMVVELLDENEPNHPKVKLFSLEWVVVHDTANTLANAKANHDWVHNKLNNGTSWHYTVGEDGWYKTLEDDEVGWHAGDGSRPAEFFSTEIKATVLKPKMEISEDGFYVILGEKTTVKAPLIEDEIATTSDICEAGIWPVVIDGTYHIPASRYTTGFGGAVVINGGNRNSVGIEMSVYNKDDIWINWHRTAKLVAELLVKHSLNFDRVVFHNHFSRKPCPRTAMESNNWDTWYKLIEFEYHILKYYSGYKIEFNTLTPELLDNNGRIISNSNKKELAKYTIKITSPNNKELTEEFETIITPKKGEK